MQSNVNFSAHNILPFLIQLNSIQSNFTYIE